MRTFKQKSRRVKETPDFGAFYKRFPPKRTKSVPQELRLFNVVQNAFIVGVIHYDTANCLVNVHGYL